MKLLLVRHARAEDRLDGIEEDRLRRLNRSGRDAMKRSVRGLRNVESRINILATSPYHRAVETAEIIAQEYDVPELVELDALMPGGSRVALLQWLQSRQDAETIALVGHEPDLGCLAGWLMTGDIKGFIGLKKGAICKIEFNDGIGIGGGQLVWLMTPRQLRFLNKGACS